MSDISVFIARTNDINVLADIDLKAYEYPCGVDYFKEVVATNPNDQFALIASTPKAAVAYVTVHVLDTQAEIFRFGVLPKYRRIGVGTLLMTKLMNRLALTKCTTAITTVPEFVCDPRDLNDVSNFLLFTGFKATMLERDYFYMYGRRYDGVKFWRSL